MVALDTQISPIPAQTNQLTLIFLPTRLKANPPINPCHIGWLGQESQHVQQVAHFMGKLHSDFSNFRDHVGGFSTTGPYGQWTKEHRDILRRTVVVFRLFGAPWGPRNDERRLGEYPMKVVDTEEIQPGKVPHGKTCPVVP